jgi:hypothetical protein
VWFNVLWIITCCKLASIFTCCFHDSSEFDCRCVLKMDHVCYSQKNKSFANIKWNGCQKKKMNLLQYNL